MTKSYNLINGLIVCLLCFAVLILASDAAAKDFTGRLGLGYNKQIVSPFISDDVMSLPDYFIASDELSMKFWFTERFGMNILTGFNFANYDDSSGYNITVAGKFAANIIMEESCNFYVGGGPGIAVIHVDDGNDEDTSTGVILQGMSGIEFFFDELPNLGFDVELGLQYMDVGKFQSFGTYGGAFGLLGFHYYF